jgi:hypothetical protein
MMDEPVSPGDVQVYGTRVYFRPSSGEIVHVHQVVGEPGDSLDADRVQAELDSFAAALANRAGELDFLAVEEHDLHEGVANLTVDIDRRALIPRAGHAEH